MDQDQRELEEYFGDLKSLFLTNGWKRLVLELEEVFRQADSVVDAKDENDLWFRKGQLAVISRVLNLPDTVRMAEKESKDTDDSI